eukprot:6492525-Amphidinium_carterae.2
MRDRAKAIPKRASLRKRADAFTFRLLSINIRSLAEQGKLVYVASKLRDCEVDVACVQETRLREELDVKTTGEYSLFSTPSSRYKGGLMTLVRDRAGIQTIEYDDSSPRVSRLTMLVNGHRLHVVNGHAPITEAPDAEHADFAAQLKAVVDSIRHSGRILLCCDLNARLKGVELPLVGPLAVSECPLQASHRRSVLEYLQSLDLLALNTFVGSDDGFTWTHNSGTLHQIDFVFGSLWFKDAISTHVLGVWGFFDLATTTDHRHLFFSFDLGIRARNPKKCATATRITRFVGSAHRDEFAHAVKSGILGNWDGILSPQEYLTKLVDQAADFMNTFRPQCATPRSPWISDDTWNCLLLLNKYRRLSSAMFRGDDAYAALLADSIIKHPGAKYFPPEHADAFDACAEAIHVLTRATRRLLRADRRRWFRSVCASLPVNSDIGHVLPTHLHQAVKRLCGGRRTRPGSRLRRTDGSIAIGKEEVDKLWMEHWQQHFKGSVTEVTDFEDRSCMLYDDPAGNLDCEEHTSDSYVYSPEQVLRALQLQPKHKATPDSIPAETWHLIGPQAAAPLAALFTELQKACAVPRSYAGARVVGVWKKKGCQMTTSQFRPISLMKFEAKLWSKLLLGQMTSKLRHHRGQYGSGHTVGVVFPQLLVRQFTAHCKSNRLPCATLFIDVSAAFDSVLKPLLWGVHPHDAYSADGDGRGSYTSVQCQAMGAFLSDHPAILAQCGLPHGLVSLLRCWGKGSWFTVDSSSACASTVGVRQGDNISALIFDIFYGFIISKLYLELVSAGVLSEIPFVKGRSWCASTDLIVVGPSAFRDDMAIPVSASTNDELLRRVQSIAEVVDSIHKQYHLEVNWSRSKTEVTLAMVAPTAKPLMQGLKNIGNANKIGAQPFS